jgi:hypothetical protein
MAVHVVAKGQLHQGFGEHEDGARHAGGDHCASCHATIVDVNGQYGLNQPKSGEDEYVREQEQFHGAIHHSKSPPKFYLIIFIILYREKAKTFCQDDNDARLLNQFALSGKGIDLG